MGTYKVQGNISGVDPNLLRWTEMAAQSSPYNVIVTSGYREGDPRFHGQKKALDVVLQDPTTGKTVPNYQSAESFAAYQGFANTMRTMQMQANPEMAGLFRWGGYFSGGKGKYGALDLMHFDVGGDTVGMAGGGWDTGLTPEQAAIWGLQSGGGYTGAGQAASAFQDAMAPPAEAEQSLWAKTLGGAASGIGGASSKSRQPSVITFPEPEPPPEIDVAPVQAQAAPAPEAQPEQAVAGLADLFKVGDIGSRIGQAARLPGTRRV